MIGMATMLQSDQTRKANVLHNIPLTGVLRSAFSILQITPAELLWFLLGISVFQSIPPSNCHLVKAVNLKRMEGTCDMKRVFKCGF